MMKKWQNKLKKTNYIIISKNMTEISKKTVINILKIGETDGKLVNIWRIKIRISFHQKNNKMDK